MKSLSLAKRVVQRTLRLRRDRFGLVLLYHRVADLDQDPQLLAVSLEHFENQVSALRREAAVLGLDELCELARADRIPRRAVAITFDDGYADNLHAAQPVLEQHGCRATVFVAAGYVDRASEFWWDELERLILMPGRIPARLTLSIAGKVGTWDVGTDADYPITEWRRHRSWSVADSYDPTRRHAIYRELHGLLRPLPLSEQWTALSALAERACSDATPRSSHAILSGDEVRMLANGSTITIGSHTIGHPVLRACALDEQAHEIRESKRRLEAVAGRTVSSFSYPYGSTADYGPETVGEVRAAGFSIACSNFEGAVDARTPRLEIPRVLVRDWAAPDFMARVRSFWH